MTTEYVTTVWLATGAAATHKGSSLPRVDETRGQLIIPEHDGITTYREWDRYTTKKVLKM